jgi:DNA polymerase-3 subunit delta
VSATVEPLHLILDGEEFLVARAVGQIIKSARAAAGTDDIPVNQLRAGDVSTLELAELLSPSLLADADEAGRDAVALIASAAADLPPGTVLAVVHSGGGRAKALVGQLRELGAEVHQCAKMTKSGERAGFVRSEFRSLKVKPDEDTVSALIDAIGSDLRELAAACSQLVADTGGQVDAEAVRRYHSGKEVTGFEIADKAVVGDIAGSAEAVRWAMARGIAHVLLADALAEAVHTIARVRLLDDDPYRLAGQLGMPGWRIKKAQDQARHWSEASVATAIRLVAALNADVKGAAADPDYAVENAVRTVAELAASGRRPGR